MSDIASATQPASGPPRDPARSGSALLDRPWVKATLIALTALVLMVPLAFIAGVTGERDARRLVAVESIHQAWASAQAVATPVLLVPALRAGAMSLDDRIWVTLTPVEAELGIELAAESRARGIFSTVVYRAQVAGALQFAMPEAAALGDLRLLWDEALLVAPIADQRGAKLDARVRIGVRSFALLPREKIEIPGLGPTKALVAVLGDALAEAPARAGLRIEVEYGMRGSGEFLLTSLARDAKLRVASNWPHPSFIGGALADHREIGATGFKASWTLGAADLPAQILSTSETRLRHGDEATLGVALADPVPAHRLVERAQKYDLLLIAFTFLVFFLFETLWGARLHIVHYAVVGLALCLFYLLLLSFAEIIGFVPAYVAAASLVVAQASLYGWSLLRSRQRAGVFALVLAIAYGYFFVLLMLESRALVAGALALFVGLSVVMYATRRIDWVGSNAVNAPP